MPLSYRNLISGNKIMDTLGSIGDKDEFQRNLQGIIKDQRINPKYIKGYESETFWESVFGGQLGANGNPEMQSRFGALFGFENKELDPYDPYTVEGAKIEEFWEKPGRILFPTIDEDVNLFRNVLYPDYSPTSKIGGLVGKEQYEDPIKLGFEVYFDIETPFFSDSNTSYNSISSFFEKYGNSKISGINDIKWREKLWKEFKDKLFTIFEKNLENDLRNVKNKPYYINKITGLNNLNKKITKFGEDKLTITLNEDVRMISWYLSELYNNIAYSYKNKRYMIPENLLRFNMHIKIHDFRNFVMPYKETQQTESHPENVDPLQGTPLSSLLYTDTAGVYGSGEDAPESTFTETETGKIAYNISPKSTIMFTLRDCTFNFFDSYNFKDDITQAGYDASMPTHSELQFEIIYKSVTRWTDFALLGTSINPWVIDNTPLQSKDIEQIKFKDLQRIKSESPNTEPKGFWNDKLGSVSQTVANAGLNYLDNLETRLREERGKFVESSLNEFRNWTSINKIEPDNVYSPDFNNRLSLKNAGKALASDLLNDLEGDIRDITNF